MPNIILHTVCQNNCPFCFVGRTDGSAVFSLVTLQKILPFLHSFGRDSVNLLGGEPTLHPEFLPILQLLLAEGFRVKIFTNGIIPAPLVDQLQKLSTGDYSFCVNRSRPELPPETVRLYRTLGYRIQAGVTVYQPDQPLRHILDEIRTYRLEKYFRLGIALPVWPQPTNQYLNPRDYPAAAAAIFALIIDALRDGIRPEFDCGFPFCFFDDAQRNFFAANHIDFLSNCGPIPDIGPGLTARPCFPLSQMAVAIQPTGVWSKLHDQIQRLVEQTPRSDLFSQCNRCPSRQNGDCAGGCRAFRFNPTAAPG